MATVAETSLSDAERRTLDRLVRALESRLGDDLLALWLFGSKARGGRRRTTGDGRDHRPISLRQRAMPPARLAAA